MPEKKIKNEHPPYRMRIPGFVSAKDIGLGDAIKHVTYGLGIRPCNDCERRAAVLNHWFMFTRHTK